jgi:PEP-CTERM motif
MKGLYARSIFVAALLLISTAALQAGPVFQSQGFDLSSLPNNFQLNLNVYPYAPPDGSYTGPLSGANINGGGAFKAMFMNGGLAGTYFPTFCIEYSEHFSPGTTYTATVEPNAMYGGNGGASGTPLSDPVGSATQFLYRTFLLGQLDGFGLGFDYGSQDSYIALQTAIWSLEDESGFSIGPLGLTLKNWALANAGTQDYGVRALNLWNGAPYNVSTAAQSQLIWVTPEPNSLLLLGVALLALTAMIRFSGHTLVRSRS